MSTTTVLTLTQDPVWPWSLPFFGPLLLAAVGLMLVVLTVWTYAGVPGAKWSRIVTLVVLRLLALIVVVLALLRPSLAARDELKVPSLLLVAADHSESMSIQDEYDGQSRWGLLLRTLRECRPLMERLREEQNVEVRLFRFAADVAEFDPDGKPDGQRTDMGQMLMSLYERHRTERYLRGLFILSDGADNGVRHQPLVQAQQWRNLPCPVHTIGFGKPTTREKQNDIDVAGINVEPSPVPIKGEMVVKGTIDAPGFERARVRLRLFFDDEEVLARDETLEMARGNEVALKATAPSKPGEIKVTLRVQPLPGEVTESNNEISTYVTVVKEGISVLLVDKERVWEPQLLCDALRSDPRIRLFVAWMRGAKPLDAGQADLFQFDKQHYDVIILGDVTSQRLTDGNPLAMQKIRQLVNEKGVGLIMMGGYDSFGPSWRGTDIEQLLPVQLGPPEQVADRVKMVPTEAGLRHYVMRLGDRPEDNDTIWARFRSLDGMNRLGPLKPGTATVLAAQGDAMAGAPVLVAQNYGAGRVLAFAGDSTYRWITDAETQRLHARFWKQLVIWLAKQEDAEGNVWVKPDTRRLPAGSKVGITAGLRGRSGLDLPDGQFQVKVIGPEGGETPVPTARDKINDKGTFWKTDSPGEYRVVAVGKGKDVDGREINGEATARFLVYRDDAAEKVRRAADHEFLKRLAATGGGQFHRPDQLARLLEQTGSETLLANRPKVTYLPDWKSNHLSPFLVGYFLTFAALLSIEWILRRLWGLV